jgi:hypothetical protein
VRKKRFADCCAQARQLRSIFIKTQVYIKYEISTVNNIIKKENSSSSSNEKIYKVTITIRNINQQAEFRK